MTGCTKIYLVDGMDIHRVIAMTGVTVVCCFICYMVFHNLTFTGVTGKTGAVAIGWGIMY
jgi:hypothetical protein